MTSHFANTVEPHNEEEVTFGQLEGHFPWSAIVATDLDRLSDLNL